MYMWCIYTTKAFFSKNVFSKNALGNKQSQNKAMMIYVCAKRLMIWPIWLVRSVYPDPKYQKKLMPKFVQRSVWIAALWTGESENYFLSSQYSHKFYMCVVQRQKPWTLGDYSFHSLIPKNSLQNPQITGLKSHQHQTTWAALAQKT